MITRTWTKEGSAQWYIRSKDGKTISKKKDELAAICDHMNIQVDNPMNVLTQGNDLALVAFSLLILPLSRRCQAIPECFFSSGKV